MITAANAGAKPTPSANAIVRLPFEEGGGTVATDASGLGNHGSLIGNPVWAQGGLVLNGDDHVQVAASASLDLTQLTLAAWIKPDTLSAGAGVISHGVTTAPYTLQLGQNGKLRFTVAAGTPAIAWWESNAAVAVGRWQHVAVTYDGTRIRFYIGGILDGNKPETAIELGTTDEPLAIGAYLLAPGGWFAGAIRDARVHDGALSPTEIAALAADEFVPRAIGAFLNGALPARRPGSLSGIAPVVAFSNLTFDDPLVIRPAPNSNRLW
ncbi:MAG: LamG domain-containing protein, partial [Mycobacterium sp.]